MLLPVLASITMANALPYSRIIRVDPVALEPGVPFETDWIGPGFGWNEAIVSWNLKDSKSTRLKVEAKVAERWYVLAEWSGNLAIAGRRSVPNQKDEDAEVQIDLLKTAIKRDKLKLRLTAENLQGKGTPILKLLAVSFADRSASESGESENGPSVKPLEAPRRAQGPHEHGKLKYKPTDVSGEFEKWFRSVKGAQYCSPTSVSMVLGYWANELAQPELNLDVPEVVPGVFDEKYPGTGNWPFNTAFMGGLPGMRSYVTRLTNVGDLEKLLAAGMPVICSVAHNLALGNGKPAGGDGHLVVAVGVDEAGDIVCNDPGTAANVRRTFSRANFLKAWNTSGRTVYICHPERFKLPMLTESTLIRE